MKKKKLILIGSGGHALSCIDIIEENKNYEIIGLLGKKKDLGKIIKNYKVIGTEKDLLRLKKKGIKDAFVTLGGIKNLDLRYKIFKDLKKKKFHIPIFKSKNSYVSKNSKILAGTIIMHGVIVNSGCKVGYNCIINSKSLIEHGCDIGNNVHVSTGAIINGEVKVGSSTFIGSGALLKNNVKILPNSFIKMGAILKK